MGYQEDNAKIISKWCQEGWEWGKPITHEEYLAAKNGDYKLYLTPTKEVPKEWLSQIKGKKVLGLASGGAQQMPILAALGAECTVLDYSKVQCESERDFSLKEGYHIEIFESDMTKPLPFLDETFDMIIHPVSNCYIEEVYPVFKECYRVLKKGGLLLGGYDIGINYIVDDEEKQIVQSLPFNPLKNEKLYKYMIEEEHGIQFSHTIEEQIGGQVKAGFLIKDLYEDYNSYGRLKELNIPCFVAVLSKKI